jgi:putative addiction module component (TIGR02574 family)
MGGRIAGRIEGVGVSTLAAVSGRVVFNDDGDYLSAGQEAPMNKALHDQVMNLPSDEKIDLVMDLWDSIPEADWPPVPEEQILEAERRLEALRNDPGRGAPWRDAMERIRARFK